MNFYNNIDFESLIGHTTIIYGEVDTKKTFYTANFIQLLLEDKVFVYGNKTVIL